MIDIATKEAQQFLNADNYDLAMPGALISLKLANDVYGPGKTQLVSSYFLLSEAHLGMGNFKQAEEHLSLADWTILKNADSTDKVKAKLYRNFGKLYTSLHRYQDAVKQLANNIYHLARIYGPEHVNTSNGYFLLGRVFEALSGERAMNDQGAVHDGSAVPENFASRDMALFDKVVEIWHRFFALTDSGGPRRERLQDGQVAEACEMLMRILKARSLRLGPDHIESSRCLYTLALLHKYNNDLDKSKTFVTKALSIHTEQLGATHEETITIRTTLEVLQGLQSHQMLHARNSVV